MGRGCLDVGGFISSMGCSFPAGQDWEGAFLFAVIFLCGPASREKLLLIHFISPCVLLQGNLPGDNPGSPPLFVVKFLYGIKFCGESLLIFIFLWLMCSPSGFFRCQRNRLIGASLTFYNERLLHDILTGDIRHLYRWRVLFERGTGAAFPV